MAKKRPTKTQKKVTKTAKSRTKVNKTQAPGLSVWQLSLLSTVSLLTAYIFASLAIDSGSLWHYLLCFAATYLVVKFAAQAVRTFSNERSKK